MVQNNITMYRGDTFTQIIFINDGDVLHPIRHELSDDEKLYIGIREPNVLFEDSIIRKVYTSESDKTDEGDIIFTLKPTDTEFLHTGTYYLCAKLVKKDIETGADISVRTIVDDTLFFII